MGKTNEPKHVYIFGTPEFGFHGFSYNKEEAKAIHKHRKGYKMVKIKNDEYCRNNLSLNEEFIDCGNNIFMTGEEEEYFIESFDQFKIDALFYIDLLFKDIEYIKFTDEELAYVYFLLYYLKKYKDYIKDGELHPIISMDEDQDIFDTDAARRWFMENVLDK